MHATTARRTGAGLKRTHTASSGQRSAWQSKTMHAPPGCEVSQSRSPLIEQFAEAGADLISIHAETDPAILHEAFARIAGLGLKAGLVLQLETPVKQAEALLGHVDMLTLVSTPIGIKGVQPDETTYLRLAQARALLARMALTFATNNVGI